MCFACSNKIGTPADVIPGKMTGIPINGVLNDDFFTLLAWAWCINPEKVKKAFKEKASLSIDTDDFPKLVKGHASGNDVKAFGVNFLTLVNDIDFTPAERKKASCEIILTRPK